MNKQAVRLNINAEELALCKPESVQAMDLAIRKVLSEMEQAKAEVISAFTVTDEVKKPLEMILGEV